jgi:hypothetical protein
MVQRAMNCETPLNRIGKVVKKALLMLFNVICSRIYNVWYEDRRIAKPQDG